MFCVLRSYGIAVAAASLSGAPRGKNGLYRADCSCRAAPRKNRRCGRGFACRACIESLCRACPRSAQIHPVSERRAPNGAEHVIFSLPRRSCPVAVPSLIHRPGRCAGSKAQSRVDVAGKRQVFFLRAKMKNPLRAARLYDNLTKSPKDTPDVVRRRDSRTDHKTTPIKGICPPIRMALGRVFVAFRPVQVTDSNNRTGPLTSPAATDGSWGR